MGLTTVIFHSLLPSEHYVFHRVETDLSHLPHLDEEAMAMVLGTRPEQIRSWLQSGAMKLGGMDVVTQPLWTLADAELSVHALVRNGELGIADAIPPLHVLLWMGAANGIVHVQDVIQPTPGVI